MSSGSRIENPGFSPSAFASPRMMRAPSAWNVEIASSSATLRAALPREQLADALAHLARRLVGERDRRDAPRVEAALEQVPDLRCDHARLAAAGARQHEQRTVEWRTASRCAGLSGNDIGEGKVGAGGC